MFTADDVLKARLKTVGVAEYKFEMEVSAGRDSGTEWGEERPGDWVVSRVAGSNK